MSKTNALDRISRISRVATKLVSDTAVAKESGVRGQPTVESPGTGQSGNSVHNFFDLLAQVGGDVIPLVNAYGNSPASTPKTAASAESPAAAPSGMGGATWWIVGGVAAVALFLVLRRD